MLGTSSSESALPRMIDEDGALGCAKPVVGLVIPAGYSFNLDGTSIYLSMAAIFIAQASTSHLSLGAAAQHPRRAAADVEGRGRRDGLRLHRARGTLSAMRTVPVEGLALLLGVDRFMSEARAITNLIGNGVATIVIAKSENAFDEEKRQLAVEEIRGERLAGAEA